MTVGSPEACGGWGVRVGDRFALCLVLTYLVGAMLLERGDIEISLIRVRVHAVVSVFSEAIVNFLV